MELATLLVGLVADLLSAASLVVLALTIREMRKQRLSAYAPDLFFLNATVHVAWLWQSIVPIRIAKEPITDSASEQKLEGEAAPLQCVNLGAGPATHVEGEWLFDISAFVRLLKQKDERASIESTEPEIRIRTRLDRNFRAPVVMDLPTQITVPFVMPSANSTVNGVPLALPVRYLHHAAAVAAILGDGIFSSASELPELSLHVTYRDREGNRHARTFGFAVNIIFPTASISERNGIGGTVHITLAGTRE